MNFFKKLLMGSVALSLFAISILLFQISCTKSSWGNDKESCSAGQGKLVLYTDQNDQDSHPGSKNFWLMDSNGGNRRKVNIVFPYPDMGVETGRLVDNGTKIILTSTKATDTEQIGIVYKCNLDGSGLTELFRGASYINVYQMSDTY